MIFCNSYIIDSMDTVVIILFVCNFNIVNDRQSSINIFHTKSFSNITIQTKVNGTGMPMYVPDLSLSAIN